MSSFNGRIIEFPGIIVDHFVSSNLRHGKLFFLSHCHKDHMDGITAQEFSSVLQSRSTHLYCSEVTRALLRCFPDCKHLSPHLKSLSMEEPVTLPLSDSENLSVVLLPAGHCPGSTMFLFQQGEKSVLYTGDFRLGLDDLQRMPALHSKERVVDLDCLYIDTTFCHPNVTKLPSRESSRDEVLHLVDSWLSESSKHVVQLDCGCFGYEHIFLGVFQKFGQKVHVNQWRYRAYSEIPAVLDCLTTNGEETRVHACRADKGSRYGKGLPCGSHGSGFTDDHPRVLRVKPSTQWFARNSAKFDQIKVFLPGFNYWRVLHSMHASYSEIRDFVQYLRPKSVMPCVVTPWDSKAVQVTERLQGLTRHDVIGKRPPENCTKSKQPIRSKRKCYSDDDIASSSESDDSDSKIHSGGKLLPRLLAANSEVTTTSSCSLSPVRWSHSVNMRPAFAEALGNEEDDALQTSLDLSLSEESDHHSPLQEVLGQSISPSRIVEPAFVDPLSAGSCCSELMTARKSRRRSVQSPNADCPSRPVLHSNTGQERCSKLPSTAAVSASLLEGVEIESVPLDLQPSVDQDQEPAPLFPKKATRGTQTSCSTIDLTQSSAFSSSSDCDSDETVSGATIGDTELGSQESSNSFEFIPATPEARTSIVSVAFDDI